MVFSAFLCCNRWRFDRIWARSIKSRVRSNYMFDSILDAERFSIEFEDVAQLIAANLVLLVNICIHRVPFREVSVLLSFSDRF